MRKDCAKECMQSGKTSQYCFATCCKGSDPQEGVSVEPHSPASLGSSEFKEFYIDIPRGEPQRGYQTNQKLCTASDPTCF